MARVPVDITLRSTSGPVQAGVDFFIYEEGTETEVAVYTTESGSTTISQPLTTNGEGQVTAWVEARSYDVYVPSDTVNPTRRWNASGAYNQVSYDLREWGEVNTAGDAGVSALIDEAISDLRSATVESALFGTTANVPAVLQLPAGYLQLDAQLDTLGETSPASAVEIKGAGYNATRLIIPSGAGFGTFFEVNGCDDLRIHSMTIQCLGAPEPEPAFVLDDCFNVHTDVRMLNVAAWSKIGETKTVNRFTMHAKRGSGWYADHGLSLIKHKQAITAHYSGQINGSGSSLFPAGAFLELSPERPDGGRGILDGGVFDVQLQYFPPSTAGNRAFAGYRWGALIDNTHGQIVNQAIQPGVTSGVLDHCSAASIFYLNRGSAYALRNIDVNGERAVADREAAAPGGEGEGANTPILAFYNGSGVPAVGIRHRGCFLGMAGRRGAFVSGGNEVRKLVVDATAGTFTLSVNGGAASAAIDFDDRADVIEGILETALGADNVRVLGGPGASGGGNPFWIIFVGTLAGQEVADTITVDDSSLTGDATITVDVPVVYNAKQTLEVFSATGGTFTLTAPAEAGGGTTAAIAYNATASAVQTALEGLPGIAPGDVAVTGGPLLTQAVVIEFESALAETAIPIFTHTDTGLTGPSTRRSLVVVARGGGVAGDLLGDFELDGGSILDITPGNFSGRRAVITAAAEHIRVHGVTMPVGNGVPASEYGVEIVKDIEHITLTGNDASHGVTEGFVDEYNFSAASDGRVIEGNSPDSLAGKPKTRLGEANSDANASQVVAFADRLYVRRIEVERGFLMTGVTYRVGGTASGNVAPAIYDAGGARVATGPSIAQVGASLIEQKVPLTAPIWIQRGVYYVGLGFTSTTATFRGARALEHTNIYSPSFPPPASITPPTDSIANPIPAMTTY
jgi:hypothetical protein